MDNTTQLDNEIIEQEPEQKLDKSEKIILYIILGFILFTLIVFLFYFSSKETVEINTQMLPENKDKIFVTGDILNAGTYTYICDQVETIGVYECFWKENCPYYRILENPDNRTQKILFECKKVNKEIII